MSAPLFAPDSPTNPIPVHSDQSSATTVERQSTRGTTHNPTNRFEKIQVEPDPDPEALREDQAHPATSYLDDKSSSLITYNKSPDTSFDASINPYRGCEHGCSYCYARPTHEYLGLSSGLDFESVILVKRQAPEILRRELASPKWQPQTLALSGVTDPYQPVERKLQITRACLKVLTRFRNPVGIVTKNELVTRDLDYLQELNRYSAVVVYLSLTTLDRDLRRRLEPRTSPLEARLRAIEKLATHGIPVGALIAPVIPGLNDYEIPKLLSRAGEAGARYAGYLILRLPYQVKDLFADWLQQHYPQRAQKVLDRLKAMRQGQLNSSEFHSRMSGTGIFADQIRQLFEVSARKASLNRTAVELSTASFTRPVEQLELFPDYSN